MEASQKRTLGRADIGVTAMGFGAAPIGNFRRAVTDEDSAALLDAAWAAGIRYFDTAPLYGHGLSEHRIGQALRWHARDEYVISTKVGRLLRPGRHSESAGDWISPLPFDAVFDYSYDGVMRSVEDSLQRLALERIDVVFIHDIDIATHGPDKQRGYFEQAMRDGWRALVELRETEVIRAAGIGVNDWESCYEVLQRWDVDCFLLAGRYTLLEQGALDQLLPLCQERSIAVVVGGGFNSGILATGAVEGARFNYATAPAPVMSHVRRLEEVCERYAVPLKAAALQFVLSHPAIPTTVPGVRTVSQLDENVALLNLHIPSVFWDDLKHSGLLRTDAPVPHG